ncbi:MAG: DNA-binding response regulator [Cyanobacteria bacterium PR.3.49]|jgi:DNA-binding response OmpR family regulator|nr:DNA-binding response regulator [Cyanobacteria bacterium PR.3.49]
MARILLVEDDRDQATTIDEWLTAEHHNVVIAYDGEEGAYRIDNDVFDVIVLDWDLPKMTGIDILKRYRVKKGSTPVIMLTGKGTIADRESGLDGGADDYLTKPFSLRELSARIRALLRRPGEVKSNVLTARNLILDPVKHSVTKNGEEVMLLPRDFALLEFFMRNLDVVFSTDALIQRVWEDDSDVTSDALRTAIKRLRKKLDDGDDESKSVIENIPRVGYRMRA